MHIILKLRNILGGQLVYIDTSCAHFHCMAILGTDG